MHLVRIWFQRLFILDVLDLIVLMGIVRRSKLRKWLVAMQKSLMQVVVSVCDFIPHCGVLVLLMLCVFVSECIGFYVIVFASYAV